jgi:D-alanyl-lipoteichoic acid acyltransferase DltB (MBOAT superfamily)
MSIPIAHILNAAMANTLQKKSLDPAALPDKERVAMGAQPKDFTFGNYVAFVLYAPLYLAGPIVNFNDYISQCRYPSSSISFSRTFPYAIRFLFCLLTMEVVLHYLYAVAINNAKPDWSLYTPFQLSMLGYFNLHIIWLKLLLPWRFFRLWSLVDGIDPPENMVRCMSDNYSALAFWRGWHRSFNRFIVRYIFIPLGGSRGLSKPRMIFNFLLVFTFVAVWHDLNLRLLVWGWLITLFVLPEIIATLLFPAKNYKNRPNTYRWLCGLGAVFNILMMMVANLVGFAVGIDGLKGLVTGIVGDLGGRIFFIGACATLFVGSQVMFEWRESEKRRGVDLKY